MRTIFCFKYLISKLKFSKFNLKNMGTNYMATTNKKSIKNVETVNASVENSKAGEILAMTAKATEGLIKSNLGTKKSSLFKDNVLPINEKQKKSMRKKLRNVLFSICSTIVVEQNKEKQNKLINAFNEFYIATYANNDYTLASVCNENLSSEKKDIIKKALEICKK